MKALRNKIAVAGVGTTAYGSFPDLDEYSLSAEAFRLAIEDSGLDKRDIEGLLVSRIPYYGRMGEVIGIDPVWTLALPPAGRMSGIGIIEAALALATGAVRYVALLYANVGRSRQLVYGGGDGPNFWAPWGLTSPGASHALMFRRHMERYGTTTRQLGEVSVAFRRHAALNPTAMRRDPITLDDHQNARPIAEPLRLLDYCQVNDGAVCIILTTADRAKDCAKRPVFLSGFAGQDNFRRASLPNYDEDFWYDAVSSVGRQSREMAGIDLSAVDGLMCYDNFSPTVLFSLEGLGFCGRGESGPFVEGGTLQLDGKLPTNTDGGHLSNSYMQGWALNVEAVRQLRGECGERQIQGCEAIQYIASTPCTRSIIYTVQ